MGFDIFNEYKWSHCVSNDVKWIYVQMMRLHISFLYSHVCFTYHRESLVDDTKNNCYFNFNDQ